MLYQNLLRKSWCEPVLALWFSAGLTLVATAKDAVPKAEANVMVELTFRATRTYADPFNKVTLDVIFREPKGRELRVPAFWDGASVWKVRYTSPVVGTHRFRSECSDVRDKGLHGISGKVEVAPYAGDNPLFRHGALRVAEDKRHFAHADGTPFFWLGDTWWMGLCQRLRWPEEFQALAADRRAKGFNVIQIVAGLYPDMPAFDERGANEAGFPWEPEYARIRPEYFDAADRRIASLVEQGFVPCIVGAWGYHLPWLGAEKMKQHWRYLIARWGALPVVWCAAGEGAMPYYLSKDKAADSARQKREWTEVIRFIRDTDPFDRLVTIHPPQTARDSVTDPGVLDFDMQQTGHGSPASQHAGLAAKGWRTEPVMPVISGEARYEALEINPTLTAADARQAFWAHLLASGCAGHTYGANGIWQVNRRGQPYGKSPGGNNWGTTPWDEAMRLPGSSQLGYAKKLLEHYPWHHFTPHPEWAAFTDQSALSLDGCQWIWFDEGNPAKDAPAEKRFFRKTFALPEARAITRARLFVSADDWFTARLNGEKLGSEGNWRMGKQFNGFARLLKPGANVLAIVAENKPANVPANPAGLLACLELRFADGETLRLTSDATWRAAKSDAAGWDAAGFDDSGWPKAAVIARYGDAPWDKIGGQSEFDGPQAAGIPGAVRIIWVPRSEPIVVRNLGSGAAWAVAHFDPVSGERKELGEVRADDAGLWRGEPPAGNDHDWVLILQAKGQAAAPTNRKTGASAEPPRQLTLANGQLAWHFDWSEGRLRSANFVNKLSGHRFALSAVQELALNFSAAPDRVAQPFVRVADFEVRAVKQANEREAVFELRTPSLAIGVILHCELDGPTRRKWVEVTNQTGNELLLLDVEVDHLAMEGATSGGGQGQPVFVDDEVFAAIEHPAGVNLGDEGHIQLTHFPGRRLPAGATFRSLVSLVSVAKPGQALDYFVAYVQAKSLRKKKAVSIYTPLGINNQWGACPTLDDEQTLDVLGVLEKWQKKGVHLDYFTLDAGWVDFDSDLTRFRPTCYPNGPRKIIERVEALGMKFGLWFATSWGTQSCWDYPPAYPDGRPPGLPYREGYPLTAGGITFCFGSEAYFTMFKNAVLHHVRENHVRFLKFDGGSYHCDSTEHGHLPGKYSVEPMFENLIDVARSARAIAPDVFIMWYWGLRSPFWALYGDSIFESGLHMEGSGTSPFPTLYYRDSVTLAQDQNAQFAKTIPPIVKDSLGVWLADNRWGNFMGKERWREALVMDLGSGHLLFPNLWGNLYHLTDDDVDFLARMNALARENESLFLRRRNILGDPFRNEVYGYAHSQGARGFLFLNNAHFAARRAELRLDATVGLEAKPGTALHVVSHFPERTRLLRPDGDRCKAADTLGVWLRPFEALLLEVTPAGKGVAALPVRSISSQQAAELGGALVIRPATLDDRMEVRFADASQFERQGYRKKIYAFESTLPSLEGAPPILSVAIRLRKGDAEWRYSPAVVQIVQALARIGDQNVQLIPVPDGRQFGNTQKAGCSWVVYKTRLNPQWARQPLKVAVHAYLPDGVEAQVEVWVVKRWWEENTRPASDGYYTDAPS